MMVTVKKLGGSVAVVIPKAVAREMELIEGTSLDVSVNDAGIVLKKRGRRPRRSLHGIVARINPQSYRRHSRELSEGRAVGREIW
jgi:AbrB family looped-hinge helix DNA binding protein